MVRRSTSRRSSSAHKRAVRNQEKISRALRATAYHEAGHAVALWAEYMRFKEASIIPNEAEGRLGHVAHRMPRWFNPELDDSPRQRLRAEKFIIVAFAGELAESKFLGRKVREGFWRDYKAAVDLGMYFCGTAKTTGLFLDFLRSMASDLIDSHWWAVKVVANELVAKRTLRYADVAQAMEQAGLAGAAWGRQH